MSKRLTNGKLLTRADDNLGDGVFDSIQWCYEVHVKRDLGTQYKSAVLYGNEDCPERIEFYTQAEPKLRDRVAFVWVPEV